MNDATTLWTEKPQPDLLTETLQSKLSNPETNSDFDLHCAVNDVLKDVGMSAADSGGKLTFYGRDPIIPSPHRFGTMAALGLAAKSVAAAALWRHRTGEGQDVAVDVRKALRRFAGFFDLKWETINGRPPALLGDPLNPFFELPLFRETKDGRHVVTLNVYPKLAARTLSLLKSGASAEAFQNAIRQWRADDLEDAGAEHPTCGGYRKSRHTCGAEGKTMTILQATKSKASSAVSRSGRLFLLELSGDRIHSMRYSGRSTWVSLSSGPLTST